jgi:murein DD-endopeptidase MepM/ murein hydrolase activator NlpD
MIVRLFVVPAAAVALMVAGAGRPPQLAPPAGLSAPAPGQLVWPLAAWVLTQPYGCTDFQLEPAAPWCPSGHFHSGLDLAVGAGTPVRAAAAGVASVSYSAVGYGISIVLDHGGGITTLYGHLLSASLRSGQVVAAGGEIGRVGSTGLSTGPHLHFEVRRAGRPVDPNPWLPGNR